MLEGQFPIEPVGQDSPSKPTTIPLIASATDGPAPSIETSPTIGNVAKSEMTQTVTNGLVQQAQLNEQGDHRQLVLQLHPAELGQVTLQVDWENETLKAKIIASDLGTSEILNQNKQQMVQALAEEGLSFDSLDVAHDDTPHQQQEAQEGETSLRLPFIRDGAINETENQLRMISQPAHSTINIIV